MPRLTKRRIIIMLSIPLVLFVSYAVLWPAVAERVAAYKLTRVYAEQSRPLLKPVNDLLQGAHPAAILQCDELSHSHTRVQLYCQALRVYAYSATPLPASSRAKVLDEARVLDQALKANGWTADRQQDSIKTIAASVPTSPRDEFHTGGVPFHKNIGDISCNLEVDFGGPTDGASPGTINVNRFSCQQNIAYFMPHLSNYTNTGFGG